MTKARWQKLSLAEQLGNIGSEISRARHWEELNDSASRQQALERALELIGYTLSIKHRWPGLKEASYLNEIICDLVGKTNFYNISLLMVEKFCLAFGFKVRISSR